MGLLPYPICTQHVSHKERSENQCFIDSFARSFVRSMIQSFIYSIIQFIYFLFYLFTYLIWFLVACSLMLKCLVT